ncbi:MAG: class I SAM-dependent methyltransferase [Parcubacteria group bacterium]
MEKYIGLYYPESMGYFNPIEKESSIITKLIEKEVLINYYDYKNLGEKNIINKIIFYPAYIYLYKHRSLPKYRINGRILEIGCSNGIKLKKLKDIGWDTKGIEPSCKASEDARNNKGLDVETGSIFDFDFPEKSFDVIILDMVLEHLYNPHKALKKISKWLRPDGQLIFSIPYFNGVEYKFFKKYSYGLQLPNHITFFNKNSISRLLKKDFKKISYSFHHFDRDIIASSHYKYEETGSRLYKFIAQNKLFRWSAIKPFVLLLSFLGKTSRVTIFAIKK